MTAPDATPIASVPPASPPRGTPDVVGAFVFLTRRSLRNRLRRMARQMRSPRYAIPLLLGVAYFVIILARPAGLTLFRGRMFGGAGEELASLALALLAARWWLFGGDRTALAFTPAEVDFLFAAPIARRELVVWKLLRAQTGILVSAVLWVLLSRGSTPLSGWLLAPAIWVLFATLHLHHLGAALVRASAGDDGAAGVRRHRVAIAVFVAMALALLAGIGAAAPAMRAAGSRTAALAVLGGALRGRLAGTALFPFRLALAPTFAESVMPWAAAIAGAIALLAAHAVWVLRTDAAFEEAAATASAERARRLAAMRDRSRSAAPAKGVRARRAWPPLAPRGHPALAIVWKNWVFVWRTTRPATAGRSVIGLLVGLLVASPQMGGRFSEFVGFSLAGWAAALVMFGPVWVRNDLRLDLARLDLLRAMPLGGGAIVAAEVAAGTLSLTLLQLGLLAASATVLAVSGAMPGWAHGRAGVLACALAALPLLNAGGFTIQNGAALLFPGWVRRAEAPGIELMGQTLLTMLAQILLLALALVGPVAVGGLIHFLAREHLGAWSIAPAALVALAWLAAELAVTIRWLGGVLERYEPSA